MDELTAPPSAWVDALDEHDGDLFRLRLYWRRGGGRYRPLVRPGVDLEALEDAPMADWESNELPGAHPEWDPPDPQESVEEKRIRIRRAAEHFWRLAVEWTRAHGPICDLQLRGYSNEGEVLFEEGKRCNLARPRRSSGDANPLPVERERVERDREHERERDFQARRESRLMADVHQIHHTYGDLLGSLKRERDEAMTVTQETVRLVPDLFAAASKVIHESLEQHREQVRETLDSANGNREFEVRAYAARHETIRHEKTMGFLFDAVKAGVGGLGPLAAQIFETVRGKPTPGLLEFQQAQQALSYLYMTLTPMQVAYAFPTSADEFMKVLDDASRHADEGDALRALKGMEVVFKSPRWAQTVQPDQALAARYIVGRIALLNIRKTAAESVGVSG
ncbi:hypothetical protein ACNOYE_07360 [Nannocystaceae bacterium ST9]